MASATVGQYLDDDGNPIAPPSLKELMVEAAKRKPILPPIGYIIDTDHKISDAIKKHKVEPYIDTYIPPIIPLYEPITELIVKQDTTTVVDAEPTVEVVRDSEAGESIEVPLCVACESGDCFTHGDGTKGTATADIHESKQDATQEITEEIPSVDVGAQAAEPREIDSVDESNSALQESAEKPPELVEVDETVSAPETIIKEYPSNK